MPSPSLLYIGIRDTVIALNRESGNEVWRAQLRSSDFVNVLWDGDALFAANRGEVWRLDPTSGGVLWHNELKGLGRGLLSLASSRAASAGGDVEVAEEKRRRDAAERAAAAT